MLLFNKYFRYFVVCVFCSSIAYSIPRKLRKEFLRDLKAQEDEITNYINELSGFKIEFRRSGDKWKFLINKNKDDAYNLLYKAKYYYKMQDEELSHALIKKIQEDRKLHSDELLLEIKLLYNKGLYKSVIEKISKINLGKNTRSHFEIGLLAASKISIKIFKEIWERYSKLDFQNNDKFLYELGESLFHKNKKKIAVEILKGIKPGSILSEKAKFFIALHTLVEGSYDSTLVELSEIRKKEGKSYSKQYEYLILRDKAAVVMAKLYVSMGLNEKALELYNSINRISSEFKKNYLDIAETLYHLNKYDLALLVLDEYKGETFKQIGILVEQELLKLKIYKAKQDYKGINNTVQNINSIIATERKRALNDLDRSRNGMSEILEEMRENANDHMRRMSFLSFEDRLNAEKINYHWGLYENMIAIYVDGFRIQKQMLTMQDKLIKDDTLLQGTVLGKKHAKKFSMLGQRLYEITQDILERERYVICLSLGDRLCKTAEDLAEERNKFYKENFIENVNQLGEDFYKALREFQIKLTAEERELKRLRTTYKLDDKILQKIDLLKSKYRFLNNKFLNLQDWVKEYVMNKITDFYSVQTNLVSVQTKARLLAEQLYLLVKQDVEDLLTKVLNKINAYKYIIELENNEMLLNAKNKISDSFIYYSNEREKKINHLQNLLKEYLY